MRTRAYLEISDRINADPERRARIEEGKRLMREEMKAYAASHPSHQTTDDALRAVTIGEPKPLNGPIHLADYDPAWPAWYEQIAARIYSALGDRALLLEHVGSTSVPGLPAKPVIDVLLVVPDSADEPTYVPALEAAGFRLHLREPDWHQHRLLKDPTGPNTNIHVFSPGSGEIDRMLAFRDHLRAHDHERDLYLRTKRELAARTWRYVQHYADAKSAVVEDILARALAAQSPPSADQPS